MSTPKVNIWQRVVKMDREEIIYYQLLNHFHLVGETTLSDAEVRLLTVIGVQKNPELNGLCKEVVQRGIFKAEGSVRNAISRMEDTKLIIKDHIPKRKRVSLNPELGIQIEGPILVDVKAVCQ